MLKIRLASKITGAGQSAALQGARAQITIEALPEGRAKKRRTVQKDTAKPAAA